MASRFLRLTFAPLLIVLYATAPASAQSFAAAENAPALLREPWSRGSTRYERHWQFLGPLAPDEITANPAELLRPDSPAAKRWTNQTGWTDTVDIGVQGPPAPAGTDASVFALGRVTIHRDRDGPVTLLIAADGSLEVFVNGASVYRRTRPQGFALDQDSVTGLMKQGDNDVVLRLEHRSGPWRVALRAVEPGTVVTTREEIAPSLVGSDPKVLLVQTHREKIVNRGLVDVEVVGPGGTVVARGTGTRGDTLPFATAAWPDGPYEVRCTTDDGWGHRRGAHLPWYKGDALAAARELVAAAANEPAGPAGDTVRMLAAMVQDRLHGKLDAPDPDAWRNIHSPLLEYRELLLNRAGKTGSDRPWGFVRLAYADEVDGSTQYCRAYLPPGYNPARRWPLVAFLHGYNPGNPEYIGWWSVDQRHNSEADNANAIVIEPHGRGNTSYRGFGEKDVLRAVAEAKRRFAVDDDRVYLTGESMGGHGTWWVATRNPDVFAAAVPVYGGWDQRLAPANRGGLAGFVPANDAQRFNAEFQSSFVSAENLRNVPLFVHHGSADPAVNVENSRYAVHLLERWGYDIGYEEHVGWAHEDLGYRGRIVEWLLTHKRVTEPKAIRLRAADLGAASAYWLRVDAWDQPARLMNVDAEFVRPGLLRLDTDNVAALTLTPPESLAPAGSVLTVVWNGKPKTMTLKRRQSAYIELGDAPSGLAKHRGLEGSIQDVLSTPFVVVIGTSSPDPRMREICREKGDALAGAWTGWQKHRPRVRTDAEITAEEKHTYSLILIGGPDANSVTAELAAKLPLAVGATSVTIDGKTWPVIDGVVQLIYPNPVAPERYVVVVAGTSAAGLFFWNSEIWNNRFGFDTVLWDWTIQDGRRVTLPPGSVAEDAYVAAGIFDRSWRRDDRSTTAGNADLRAKSPLRHGPMDADAAAKVSVKSLAGQYELYPGYAVRLFEQDDKFWFQAPGQAALRLLPESDTEFGVVSSGDLLRFELGPDQSVTGLLAYTQGREVPYKRLPTQP